MKTSTFKLIVYVTAGLLTFLVINSCKTKQKLVHKTTSADQSVIQKSDSTKVVSSGTIVKTKTDSSKKNSDFTKEIKTRSYTEIEFGIDSGKAVKLLNDTIGSSAKNDIINSILTGAKNVKIKIWDYQAKREQGKSEEQAAIKETEDNHQNKDSASVKGSSEHKDIKTTESTVSKSKDSSASKNWVGWLIAIPIGSLVLWLAYKLLKK